MPTLIALNGVSFTDGPGCTTQGTTKNGLDFTTGCYGHAVDDRGAIVATTDGGATWTTQVPSPSLVGTGDLYGAWFADHANGWAVGDGGKILATADGGRTWAPQNGTVVAPIPSFASVAFANRSRGWAVSCLSNTVLNCDSGSGVIVTTADGGRTWSSMLNPGDVGLRDVAAVADPARGVVRVFAVGEGGRILRLTTPIAPTALRLQSVSCTRRPALPRRR
ncbi:MAG TPA: hypothetical protein VM142_08395 [Acidimicrobiales bacterium]|nr:hypothetical protein [Acidimicrobiales bacterium]